MIPASIIIPMANNDGRPFGDEQFALFENRLFAVAGGFTRRDNVTGAWRADDATIYRDISFEYEVSFGSWRDIARFLDIADWARSEFQQLAIYVKVAGIPEILDG